MDLMSEEIGNTSVCAFGDPFLRPERRTIADFLRLQYLPSCYPLLPRLTAQALQGSISIGPLQARVRPGLVSHMPLFRAGIIFHRVLLGVDTDFMQWSGVYCIRARVITALGRYTRAINSQIRALPVTVPRREVTQKTLGTGSCESHTNIEVQLVTLELYGGNSSRRRYLSHETSRNSREKSMLLYMAKKVRLVSQTPPAF